jgi:hypothetical protein
MSTQHRHIPILPKRPSEHVVAGSISRSYPVGRQSFSRACKGKTLIITISFEIPFATTFQANLISTLNSSDAKVWEKTPFFRNNLQTLVCQITPQHVGLHSFRAEFSVDNGNTWHRDTVPDAWILVDPPQTDDLRMYTLIPNVSGTVTDWKTDLTRIKQMGFNAVHLLPITALDTSQSPYSAHDLFDIDQSYLSNDSKHTGLFQLEEFIKEAKRLNIKLCFDLVLNHIGVNSRMAKRAPDWIVPDPGQPDGFQRARYWANTAWHSWDDLILINFEHPSEAVRSEIWSYMIEYALFWAKYANDTDGFVRFDNLHSSEPDFVDALTTRLHAEYPNVGILAEYFTNETTLLHTGPKWGLNLNLATPWDYKFVPQLREYLKYIHRVSKHIRYYMPVTSHDSGTPAQEFGSAQSTLPRYVAAALLGTGATGITQGVEYGMPQKIDFIGRKPKITFPEYPIFADFISTVNTIITNYPAFRQGENCIFVDNNHESVIAAFRLDNDYLAFGFLVVCNFDIYNTQNIEVDLSHLLSKGRFFTCRDLLTDQVFHYVNDIIKLSVQACGAMVLKFS